MKKILITALVYGASSSLQGGNVIQGNYNYILGTKNNVKGNFNKQITHNVHVKGHNNLLVGANYKVQGNNVHMFGPTTNVLLGQNRNGQKKGNSIRKNNLSGSASENLQKNAAQVIETSNGPQIIVNPQQLKPAKQKSTI